MLVHLCAGRHPHRHTPPLSQSASSPSLPVVARCSSDGWRLMDESPLSSSVKAPLYQGCNRTGPSHLIRSQWKPVSPCHRSYGKGRRSNSGGHRGAEVDALRKPFFCARRGYHCKTRCRVASVARGRRRVWQRDTQSGLAIQHISCDLFIAADMPYRKPHLRFCHSNCSLI